MSRLQKLLGVGKGYLERLPPVDVHKLLRMVLMNLTYIVIFYVGNKLEMCIRDSKAVYAVEPVSGHPAYRVSRNITVKEPETEAQTKSSSENTVGEGNAGETEDSGNAEEDVDSDGSKEIVTDLTDGQEVTTDEESGLTVSEVMDQAENEGIDLYEMEPGLSLIHI